MNENDKWDYINYLDEKLQNGGIVLSEWTTFQAKDAEIAYCANANLASILASQAAIESHLRFDFFSSIETKKWGFYKLIENSDLDKELKAELHELRIFRNRWVHVNDPSDDSDLLERPEYQEEELSKVAKKAIETMLKVLYYSPWI